MNKMKKKNSPGPICPFKNPNGRVPPKNGRQKRFRSNLIDNRLNLKELDGHLFELKEDPFYFSITSFNFHRKWLAFVLLATDVY
jgi:hypothetical protein